MHSGRHGLFVLSSRAHQVVSSVSVDHKFVKRCAHTRGKLCPSPNEKISSANCDALILAFRFRFLIANLFYLRWMRLSHSHLSDKCCTANAARKPSPNTRLAINVYRNEIKNIKLCPLSDKYLYIFQSWLVLWKMPHHGDDMRRERVREREKETSQRNCYQILFISLSTEYPAIHSIDT